MRDTGEVITWEQLVEMEPLLGDLKLWIKDVYQSLSTENKEWNNVIRLWGGRQGFKMEMSTLVGWYRDPRYNVARSRKGCTATIRGILRKKDVLIPEEHINILKSTEAYSVAYSELADILGI